MSSLSPSQINEVMNTMKVGNMPTPNDIKNPYNVMINPEEGLSADGIGDLDKITAYIAKFLEYVETPDMNKLYNTDKAAYSAHVENKFRDFTTNYMAIYGMLSKPEGRRDNVRKLISLLEKLREIKAGHKNINNEFDKFRDELADEFIYKKYGGAAGFEREMITKKRTELQNNKQRRR